MAKDQPLVTEIEDGELRIRIGIDTLKFSAENSPDDRICWFDEESGEFVAHEITDACQFAQDVLRELNREEEDGTTPLHICIDNAIVGAIEDGSIAVSEEPKVTDFRRIRENS